MATKWADWRKDRFMKGKAKNLPGLYLIVNRITGRKYVGQSKNIQQRREEHWGQLSRGCHYNRFLQDDYNEYGKDAFVFSVLEYFIGDQGELDKREQYWINKLCATYNIEKDIAYSRAYHSSVVAMAVETVGVGDTYQRPEWHAWVYGGAKNPLLNVRGVSKNDH
jgi:group I intron endonuclease